MYITCRDLLNLNIFSDCKLWTGDAGLDNIITWPYTAKTLLSDNYFYGGEFILVAETYVKYDEAVLLDFLDLCARRNVAGILIFINHESKTLPSLPKSVIEKACLYSIPLFELPWNVRNADVIKKITMLIAENKLRNNAIDNAIKNIIFFEPVVAPESYKQLIGLGYINDSFYLARFELFHFTKYCQNKNFTREPEIHNQKQLIKRHIHNLLSSFFPDDVICSNSNVIIIIIRPRHQLTEAQICDKLNTMRSSVEANYPELDLRGCLSQRYPDIYALKDAFHETSHLIRLSFLEENRNKLITYNNIGIYRIFFSVPAETLQQVYHATMTPLVEYDRQNDSNLLETLRIYLEKNCNLDEVSATLYIHRNTIRYRLKQIEKLTNRSLKSTEDLSLFFYCTAIQKYLKTL